MAKRRHRLCDPLPETRHGRALLRRDVLRVEFMRRRSKHLRNWRDGRHTRLKRGRKHSSPWLGYRRLWWLQVRRLMLHWSMRT